MRPDRVKNRLFTEGEGCLALAYLMVAFFGAGMGIVTVTRLSGGAILSRGFTNYESWIVLTAAIGATAALFLAGERMGQPGLRGHFKGGFGIVWVSTIGAIISGTLALPLYGTMFGPLLLAGTLANQPLLAAFWVANLFGAHLLIGTWRRERATLLHLPARETMVRQGRGLGLSARLAD